MVGLPTVGISAGVWSVIINLCNLSPSKSIIGSVTPWSPARPHRNTCCGTRQHRTKTLELSIVKLKEKATM